MAKTKHHKIERVKHLPNVSFSLFGEVATPDSYPWNQAPYADMATVLELGCGKGEHSLAFAMNEDLCCVGVDAKDHRICVGAEIAIAAGQKNVHFLRARIERIREYFRDHSISEIWLTFPDPHLKKRSAKNRLTAPTFLDAYAHLLAPGGTVHLKTDSDSLYESTRHSVEQWGGQIVFSSENIHEEERGELRACDAVSAFETAARTQGKTIKYMAFTLMR